MRFCRACRHLTAGSPTFCPRCGGSYDIKLCPKLHINARSSSVCSICGSRELSSPQPTLTVLMRLGLTLLRVLAPLLLLTVTVLYGVTFVAAAAHDPSDLLGRMLVGLGLGCLWLLYVSASGRTRKIR
jgi:RNA polymerase subunit RPABC4/transcription elongation factor Spt4